MAARTDKDLDAVAVISALLLWSIKSYFGILDSLSFIDKCEKTIVFSMTSTVCVTVLLVCPGHQMSLYVEYMVCCLLLVPCAPMSIVCPLPSCYPIIVSVAPPVSPSLPSFVSIFYPPGVCSPVLIHCLSSFVCYVNCTTVACLPFIIYYYFFTFKKCYVFFFFIIQNIKVDKCLNTLCK